MKRVLTLMLSSFAIISLGSFSSAQIQPAPGASGPQGVSVRPPVQIYATQEQQPAYVMIVLDTSLSMSEKLPSGETKMAAAKRTILDFMQKLPPHVQVGLRVYGDSEHVCESTHQLVPIAANNRIYLSSQMVGIRPTGYTPISYTLERSIKEDFNHVVGQKSIILVSDGVETCGPDPCKVAVAMVRHGVDIKINVVGFGIDGLEAGQQLKCIAQSTFGQFYNARTAAELARSLQRAAPYRKSVQGQIIRTPRSNNPQPLRQPSQVPANLLGKPTPPQASY